MRWIAALMLAMAPSVNAQDGPIPEPLATFDHAVAMAMDTQGRIYVVDQGQEVLLQLDADGKELAMLGGPGGGDGEFDLPSDVDPGTGLTWLVADTGNGRLQRFSQTFLHLETLLVPRNEHFQPGSPSRLDPRVEALGSGHPIAVAQSPTGELFAIEKAQGLVMKWDKSRRLERVIGDFVSGEGALAEPVALAVNTERLFVADRELRAILVYDLFGGYIRTLLNGQAHQVQALALAEDLLWIVLPKQIITVSVGGRRQDTIPAPEGHDLVDAIPAAESLYLLTRTTLARMPR